MSDDPATGLELVWRYDPAVPDPSAPPETAAAAQSLLEQGNQAFADALRRHAAGEAVRHVTPIGAQDVGLDAADAPPAHVPFAAVVGCSDARVPLELVLGQQANDVFVVRVAGNVLGRECLGSLEYAVDHLERLRLLVVLGHTNCGAVRAAVDAYLDPPAYLVGAADPPLRAIIDGLMAPVRAAAQALDGLGAGLEGDPLRDALVTTAVTLNAAVNAASLRHVFRGSLGDRLDVRFGVYALEDRTVSVLSRPGLGEPPGDQDALDALARAAAQHALRA
ncbi:MAG TPA: carbonic anhydrase [Gaiella sp.]|nr:carbonic anhydrase [Gaiella sp.]